MSMASRLNCAPIEILLIIMICRSEANYLSAANSEIQLEQSDSWRRCRKRNYAMSIKRLFDAVERRGDIGGRVAALVLPISNRPRVTSSCTGKIRLCEPGEHTSGPNLASQDNVAHSRIYIRFWKRRHRPPCFILSDGHMLARRPAIPAAPRCRYRVGAISRNDSYGIWEGFTRLWYSRP